MDRFPLSLSVAVLLASYAMSAEALPRFAARTGADCRLCHVSPSGGGMRSRYGSSVFQQLDLPLRFGGEAEDNGLGSFSPQLTEWLSLGADVRTAYIYSAPERSPVAGAPADPTSSFLLMQADLYAAARLGPHFTVALDLGVYAGFEAWALVKAASRPSTFDLYLKVGRFMPPFGLRDPNHDLYTRAGIGLGASDRDTGVELTGIAGPFTLALALVNGTFGDLALDGHGTDHRSFEKALVSRVTARFGGESLHVQLGASSYWNDNVDKVNPLFKPGLPGATDPALGVEELRVGAFVLAGLGRLSYSGELVYVTDVLKAQSGRLEGYAAAQELGVQILQGIELLGTFEFADPDMALADNATIRVGGAAEVFVGPYFEARVMARHAFSKVAATGDVTDLLIFAHAAF